ncbi:hypothetical protein LCGC14_0426920 [marine sediment metagenome]|uniref:GP-PDE domain-containing protein n=1 Tax=marine sediment metagenome TaxID=412755 RepID=A0A0F9SP75_9ZZZZ
MKLISHRGNINGKNSRENSPVYIKAALALGYDVEIDVWYMDGRWLLGHDEPTHPITVDYLKDKQFWCHAKNIESAYQMWLEGGIHYFYHQTDDITLTSSNYLWTFPSKRPLTPRSIAVLPENTNWTENEISKCAGICSDFIDRYNPDLSEEEHRKY